jgi:UDP-glucose 4-epimerase
MNPVPILITGANGFVGSSLCQHLLDLGYPVTGLTRQSPQQPHEQQGPELDSTSDWTPWLKVNQVVIHCAARVHVMHDTAQDPYQAFRAVNVDGTLALARQAAAAGVKRFVFISSIKVNGEATLPGRPFTETVLIPPTDPYGLSKYEAELALRDLAGQTGMDVVIVRPPLMYGPGVKANFASMMRWVAKGVPLPLAGLTNQRSLLSLANLNHFITTVIAHPQAKNQTFLVSDGDDVSTSQLLTELGHALHHPARLFHIPYWLLAGLARCAGQEPKLQRVCGSLQLDITKARQLLNWQPPLTLQQGLTALVAATPHYSH